MIRDLKLPFITLDLPPTDTHQVRQLLWVAVPRQIQQTWILELEEAVKQGRKVKVRSYLVKRVVEASDGDVYTVSKANSQEFYHVCLRPIGHDECVCKGYDKNGSCAHTQALRKLVTAGYLRAPQSSAKPHPF